MPGPPPPDEQLRLLLFHLIDEICSDDPDVIRAERAAVIVFTSIHRRFTPTNP